MKLSPGQDNEGRDALSQGYGFTEEGIRKNNFFLKPKI